MDFQINTEEILNKITLSRQLPISLASSLQLMGLIIKLSAIFMIIFDQQTMGNQLQNLKKENKTDIGNLQVLNNILKVSEQLPQDSYQTRINIPEVFCTSRNPVTGMCISKGCKFDCLMCDNPYCKACMENHFNCGMIKMPILTGLMQTRNSMHQKLVREIDQIENKMFVSLKNRRQMYLKNFFLKGFDKDYLKIVEQLFFDGDQFTFNGFKAEQFYTKLKESNSMMEDAEKKVLRTFTREIQRIAATLTILETSTMDLYIKKVRIDDLSKSTVSQIVRENVLQSQIIPPQKTQDIKFIYQNLDNPAQLQLLFRASQNGYLGQKFHAACDNKPHTLTLIRTEFDQIIAGYTPLTWNITKGVAPDQTKQSFLLSVNLKERMDLIRQQKAIQCIATEGPIFGGGSDLAIVNNCHVKSFSTFFPYSYNLNSSDTTKRYKYNQNAWTALTGVPEGNKFRVVEYEVYQVLWD